MRRRGRAPDPVDVPAWNLTEGDVLPDDRRVLAVSRNAAARTVDVLTDEPARVTLHADDPVPVVPAAPLSVRWWRGVFRGST